MNEKSEASKLYYCDNLRCRVVMFKPDPEVHDICPSCHGMGLPIREATISRLGLVRG